MNRRDFVKSEEELAKEVDPVNVAKVNHHVTADDESMRVTGSYGFELHQNG